MRGADCSHDYAIATHSVKRKLTSYNFTFKTEIKLTYRDASSHNFSVPLGYKVGVTGECVQDN